MQDQELKQRIDRLEQCADDAKRACQSAKPSSELSECVAKLHEQASAAKQACQGQQGSASQESMRRDVTQLEETADRAMQACRNAGSGVDPQLQQAIQRAHAEASSLKKDMMQAA